MIGSPLRRAAAFAAALVLVFLAWEQWTLRDLRAASIERLDQRLESIARAVANQVGDEAIGDAARLAGVVSRAAEVADARVTLIDASGAVRADSEVHATHLAAIENHADREEVREAAGGRVGRASRRSDTVGRELRYVAVPARAGGVVRVSGDLRHLEENVAFVRKHTLTLISVVVAGAVALFLLFEGFFHRGPLREVRRMAEAVADGRLDARVPRSTDGELRRVARAIERTSGQLRNRLREVAQDDQQMRAVLESMVEGVLVVDVRGVILLANSRLRDLFDVHGALVGRPLLEGIRNADLDAILSEAARTREAVGRMITLADPRKSTLQVLAAPFPKESASESERIGTVAVFHDTTELMRLEEVRRDFVANASHELRTPLAAIRGFAETLLESDSLAEADRKSYIEVIHRHALRLAAIVEDLLELSTIESRTSKLEIRRVDVASVADSWIADSRLRLEERQIALASHVEGAPLALADARAVDQVLGNLLDNAMKYTEPGGSIDVKIEERRDRVRVSISDTGIGISPEDLGRIFERFYRVDRARSRALGGTGLGLAIVKHLVQAMGGEITVESEPGRGSTFIFVLRRASGEDEAPAEATH